MCLSSALGEMKRIESSKEPVQIHVHKSCLYIFYVCDIAKITLCVFCVRTLLRGTDSFMLSVRVKLGGNYIASPQIDYFSLTS